MSDIFERRLARRVYFVGSDELAGHPVKIGLSTRLDERLKAIQHWSPFRLHIMGSLPGSFELEARFHNLLFADHLHGEWFRSTAQLAGIIASINDGSFDKSILPTKWHRVHGIGGLYWLQERAAMQADAA